MGEGRELSDGGAVASEESVVDVAAELEALRARIEKAKRSTEAPRQEPTPDPSPLPTGRFRRNLIVALVLLLLAGGAALIFVGDDGTNGGVTDPAAVTSPQPPAPAPAIQEIRPPPAPAPESLSPPSEAPASVPATTLVVVAGDSFWSIAEQVVEARGGGSTAEVAEYWLELIEVNRDRLVQAGNPDLIHVGQEFSLP